MKNPLPRRKNKNLVHVECLWCRAFAGFEYRAPDGIWRAACCAGCARAAFDRMAKFGQFENVEVQ